MANQGTRAKRALLHIGWLNDENASLTLLVEDLRRQRDDLLKIVRYQDALIKGLLKEPS